MKKTRVTRREWFAQASVPAAVTALVALQSNEASADAAPPEKDLGARIYNVRDFGAKGDGSALDTAAIQAAIDACNKDRGGTVVVPAGDFLTGTLELKSNVKLFVAAHGRLLGSGRPEHYKAGN